MLSSSRESAKDVLYNDVYCSVVYITKKKMEQSVRGMVTSTMAESYYQAPWKRSQVYIYCLQGCLWLLLSKKGQVMKGLFTMVLNREWMTVNSGCFWKWKRIVEYHSTFIFHIVTTTWPSISWRLTIHQTLYWGTWLVSLRPDKNPPLGAFIFPTSQRKEIKWLHHAPRLPAGKW